MVLLEIGSLQMQDGIPWLPVQCVLIRRENRDLDTQWEDGHVKTGRDWTYAASRPGMPRIANIHQKLELRENSLSGGQVGGMALLTP